MKVVRAATKINGIQVTEIDIKDLPNARRTMDAVYALGEFREQVGMDETGAHGAHQILIGTHGRCTANTTNWSERTMNLLSELISSMEEDLLPRHFMVSAGLEDENERLELGEDEGAHQI